MFALFRSHGLSVDMIGTSQTNVTVSLDPSENLLSENALAALAADLEKIGRVKVIVSCAAITLVGRGMRSLLHRLPEVFSSFGHERVHMISQSSNDLNLTFVIDEADADGLLPDLHAALIDSGAMPVLEKEVFGPRWRELNGAVRPRPVPWWRGERERLLGLGRGRHAALRLPPADRSRAGAGAEVGRRDRPALLRDQGQSASGDPARAGGRGSGWNAFRSASCSTCSPRCRNWTAAACCSRRASRRCTNTSRPSRSA